MSLRHNIHLMARPFQFTPNTTLKCISHPKWDIHGSFLQKMAEAYAQQVHKLPE